MEKETTTKEETTLGAQPIPVSEPAPQSIQGIDAKQIAKDGNQIAKDSLSSVIQEGVLFAIKLNNPKFWQKKKRDYLIKPLVAVQLIKISKIIVDIKAIDQDFFTGNYQAKGMSVIMENQMKLIDIIAIALTNPRNTPTDKFKDFLANNLTSVEILQLVSLVLRQLDIVPFLTSIMLVTNMSLVKQAGE